MNTKLYVDAIYMATLVGPNTNLDDYKFHKLEVDSPFLNHPIVKAFIDEDEAQEVIVYSAPMDMFRVFRKNYRERQPWMKVDNLPGEC